MARRTTADVTVTGRANTTLHWAYLEFAIRSVAAKTTGKKPPSIPVSRNIVEAIRYSYDFLDAAAEFGFHIATGGSDGDVTMNKWVTGYMDRNWTACSLSDKLCFLGVSKGSDGFWRTEGQRHLFEELRRVRNALTHPGIFSFNTVEQFADFDGPPLSSTRTVTGKMRPGAARVFVGHPADLGKEDARKAVEIALRHAQRLAELFCSNGETYFSRINPQTKKVQDPSSVLASMRKRYFDEAWRHTG